MVVFVVSSFGLGACANGEETPRTEAHDGQLPIRAAPGTPAWVPDDSNVTNRVEPGQARTSSPDRRNTEQLTDALGSRWSPDGKWISYFVDGFEDRPSSAPSELWISSADQRHIIQVSEDVWDYEWSPDGRFISYLVIGKDAYSVIQNTGSHGWVHGDLWIWSTSTGERERLSEGVSAQQWSPEGRYLSFLVDDGGMNRNDQYGELWLWAAGVDGEHNIRLLVRKASGWWWSPDGDIAYSVVDSDES